jgi:hypothetical protein
MMRAFYRSGGEAPGRDPAGGLVEEGRWRPQHLSVGTLSGTGWPPMNTCATERRQLHSVQLDGTRPERQPEAVRHSPVGMLRALHGIGRPNFRTMG